MILSIEDQAKLIEIDRERSSIEAEIETQTEKRLRLECQANLLKLQLVQMIQAGEKNIGEVLARLKLVKESYGLKYNESSDDS